jgi:hypothetical protein
MKDINFTDSFFAQAIADISVNNTLFFTPKQFLYFLDRRLKKNNGFPIIYVNGKRLKNNGPTLAFLVVLYVLEGAWTATFFGIILFMLHVQFFSKNYPFLSYLSYLLVLILFNIGFLYYLFNLSNSSKSSPEIRRSSATGLQLLGIFISLIGVSYGVVNNSSIIYATTAFVGLSAFWMGFFQRKKANRSPETFLINAGQMLGWLDSWTRVNGSVWQLLPSVSNALPAPNILPDPDATHYSFDRLVVCQSDEIAQMLIANNFHFENNCAILSISGYPQRIFETIMQMLRRNPELRVFAFHDCSPEGIKLANELRQNPRWFPDETIVIVDIGLSPRQILAAKRDMFIQSSKNSAQASQLLATSIRENLSKVELEWLDNGNFVELESFTPQQLIQVLNRSIANSQQGELGVDGTLILVGGSDSSFYATESFG